MRLGKTHHEGDSLPQKARFLLNDVILQASETLCHQVSNKLKVKAKNQGSLAK